MASGILKSSTNTGSDADLISLFVAPLNVINNAPSFAQDSMSLKRSVASQNVQRWEITANIAPTTGDPNFMLHSIKYSHSEIFYIRMPQIANLKCTQANVLINGNASAGSEYINFSGANTLVPGEFINIGNDPKVYVVREPGALGVNARIYPALRVAISTGMAVKTDKKVSMAVRFNSDVQLGISYVDGILADPGVLSMLEA